MSRPVEEPTLRTLLRRGELSLRLAADEAELPPGALDRWLRGVHSSDLADPTPFLSEDLVLLTTGTQFLDADAAAYDEYVARLRVRGVAGLGFGTEVVREGVPDGLVDACRAAGIPLFEVPYRTPFIAVARANAQALAAQEFARRSWALDAQRALSLAALRDDGLEATLDELSRRLDAWVGLFDAAGSLAHQHPAGAFGAPALAELETEVGQVLARGTRAGAATSAAGHRVQLQTLGRGGHLRGVLAVGAGDLDPEARGVVTMVVAMAGLALEQRRSLLRARGSLRAGLAASLLEGDPSTARRVAHEMWGGLPAAPVRVGLTDAAAVHREDVTEWLETRAEGRGSHLFFGRTEAGLLFVVSRTGVDVLRRAADRFGLTIGLSDPVGYADLAGAAGQARIARDHGAPGLNEFARTGDGLVLALAGENARVLARAELAPLQDHDAAHHSDLVRTLRTWLANDASHERAAQALGVHRHTLRARLATAERVLGTDLTVFSERARLWLALTILGDPA
ncbi:PucR family transcriptional regulator [Microbacterium sp. GXF7504]